MFYSVSATARQRASGIRRRRRPSSLAAVIGLSNNDVISLRSLRPLRSLRCVRCVGWKARVRRFKSLFEVS